MILHIFFVFCSIFTKNFVFSEINVHSLDGGGKSRSSGPSIDENISLTDHPGEECYRTCIAGEHKICYFKFILEHYHSMGPACGECRQGNITDCNHPQCILGDGIEKGVMSINRRIPGPPIHVCKDDLIIVDVNNAAAGTAATLHWHGLHMRATPHMDGVPFLTQCPIQFSTTFRYKFRATEPGTQFYHSHSGHHKINGQYGGIVVREPIKEDPHLAEYDYDLPEHLIVISDWMHSYGEMFVPGLPSRKPGISPDSILINGRGQYIDPKTYKVKYTPPLAKFDVDQGGRYRFRIINSVSHTCPVQIQFEGHNITILGSDSFNVKPKVFSTLVTNAGERYDFVLNANQSARNYLIRARALGSCSVRPIESFALLSYDTNDVEHSTNKISARAFPNYNNEYVDGIVLNNPNASCYGVTGDYCITELEGLDTDNELRFGKVDYKFYFGFAMYGVKKTEVFNNNHDYHHFANVRNNVLLVGAINKISHHFPSFPLLTQTEQLNQIQFCEGDNRTEMCDRNKYNICPCVHMIKIPLNATVEMIVVDESQNQGRVHHPFHLHGFRFMVMALGKDPLGKPMTVQLSRNLNENNKLPKNIPNGQNPPWKDTVSIPSLGYAVIRLRADNPGFWLLHCHFEWHLATGMGFIVQVGETSDMVKPPKDFPKCGNFLPNVEAKDFHTEL